MDTVLWDRIQFSFTIMFHYLFPVITIGLAPFIAAYWCRAAWGNDEAARRAAALWTRIFAINFAAGVVTGIPMEFQFGTNWARFSERAGSVVGQPLAMESLFAFFGESVFLGGLLYGRRVLSPKLHAVCAVVVWLTSWLSGYFIVVTNAWMQHPVGYTLASNGNIELTDLAAVLLSPFAWWQFAHVLVAAVVAGGFLLAGTGAFYLLAGREHDVACRFLRTGIVVAFVFSALTVFPTGDRNSANVTAYQPIKLAAMEGLFRSEKGAPLAILGMPDTQAQRLLDPLEVPDILSFLAYGNFRANVAGLAAYPHSLWPPVALTYYAYHVMVGLGTAFFAIGALGILLLWRDAITRTPLFWWIVLLTMPFPLIANEAGWVTAEVGRQPWIVYGLMRTSAGISPTVVAGEAIFTLIGFAGVYMLLGLLYLFVTFREVQSGP